MRSINHHLLHVAFSDALHAQIETEKRLALIKAWEESEKTKAENKYEGGYCALYKLKHENYWSIYCFTIIMIFHA